MPVSRGLGLRSAPLTTHATTKKPTRHSFSVRAENKVVREYREGDDDVTVPGSAEDKPAGNPQSVYADELPPVSELHQPPNTNLNIPCRTVQRLFETEYRWSCEPRADFGHPVVSYVQVPRSEMSAAMKEKLRKEYYGLGGSPNKVCISAFKNPIFASNLCMSCLQLLISGILRLNCRRWVATTSCTSSSSSAPWQSCLRRWDTWVERS